MNTTSSKEFSLLNHKPALFVLFFTEMWERFSYYGMRAIFVLFLTASFSDGGWEWSRERALGLLGIYTSYFYLYFFIFLPCKLFISLVHIRYKESQAFL